ncbi:MAG: hypothetical protein R6W91_00885 [Thermoplasmata archaeon]
MPKEIERLTFMESKILELGKKQHDKGYQGGSFTPGFIRKETEYGYRAINVALENLIALELVEKTVTNTFRNGSLVELDVYKITGNGLQVLDKVSSGSITVNGKEPSKLALDKPEPRSYSKPWDTPKPRYDAKPAANPELEQSVKALEVTVKAMAEDMKALHAKLDRFMASAPAPGLEKPATLKPRKNRSGALNHRVMVLEAVESLKGQSDFVLAEDVKEAYFKACAERGMAPKGSTQFTTYLKRLEAESLLSLKRVGCKNLGIKGQGSRVVVHIAPEGQRLLDQD